jgi:hypothetical protein
MNARMVSGMQSVCMCTSIAPEQLDEFQSHAAVKSLYTVGRCSVSLKIPAPKTEALHKIPQI